jgi:hypothetical protein
MGWQPRTTPFQLRERANSSRRPKEELFKPLVLASGGRISSRSQTARRMPMYF